MAIEVNLIPAPVLTRQRRKQHLHAWIIAVTPAAIAAFAFVGMNSYRRVQTHQLRTKGETLSEHVRDVRGDVRRLTDDVTEANLQLRRAETLRAKRSWSGLMGLVADAIPEDTWLAMIATDPPMPSGPQKTVRRVANKDSKAPSGPTTIDAPRKLRLTGYSLSAGSPLTLVSNLKKPGLFENVILERSVSDPEADPPRFHFEVVIQW